jgi:hypothetical protein
MKKLGAILGAAVALGFASPSIAATDGSLSDSDSSGTLDLDVTVVPMVSIRGLDDLSMTIDAATIASNFGSTRAVTQFCVFSNADALGSYKVTVDGTPGDGLGNPYGLTGTATGTQLNHTVGYYDAATYNSVGATFMRPGVEKTMENTRDGQSRATDLNCTNAGGQNSSMSVTIRNANALAALADTYTGTLSVVVSVL